MNKQFGVPIFEWLEDAMETMVKFVFQPPRELKKLSEVYLTIDGNSKGVLRYSFKAEWGFIGERFDSHEINISEKDFNVTEETEKLDLTNLFREMNLEKHPFIRCFFTRHGQNAYDTLNSRPMVSWFVLEYS